MADTFLHALWVDGENPSFASDFCSGNRTACLKRCSGHGPKNIQLLFQWNQNPPFTLPAHPELVLREKQTECPIVELPREILSNTLVNGSLHQHRMPFWKHPKWCWLLSSGVSKRWPYLTPPLLSFESDLIWWPHPISTSTPAQVPPLDLSLLAIPRATLSLCFWFYLPNQALV